jgi:hypothetical protein
MITKMVCYGKLGLIEQMISNNQLTSKQITRIFDILNDAAHQIDDYIDKQGVRDALYNRPITNFSTGEIDKLT